MAPGGGACAFQGCCESSKEPWACPGCMHAPTLPCAFIAVAHGDAMISHLSRNRIAQVSPVQPGMQFDQVADPPGVLPPLLQSSDLSLSLYPLPQAHAVSMTSQSMPASSTCVRCLSPYSSLGHRSNKGCPASTRISLAQLPEQSC